MGGLPVSAKFLFAGLLLIVFSSAVFSAPLEVTDKQVSGLDGEEVVGGERISFDVNFSNSAEENVTFYSILSVSSDLGVVGEELDTDSFEVYLNGVSGNCVGYENVSVDEKSFICSMENFSVAKPGSNEFSVGFRLVPYIKPGDYDFSLDLKTRLGEYDTNEDYRRKDVYAGNESSFSLPEGSSVTVNSSKDAILELVNWSSLNLKGPSSDSSLVESVRVNVYRSGDLSESASYKEIPATGSLNFSYSESLDESDSLVGLYYFNGSTSSWVNVTDERNRELNYVYADVDHFSTYAAYSRPTGDEEDEGDGSDEDEGGGSPPGFGGGPPPTTPPGGNDSETGDSENNQSDQGQQGNQDEDTGQNQDNGSEGQGEGQDTEGTETGDQNSEPPGNQDSEQGFWFGESGFLTGLASDSPGNYPVGVIALLLGLMAALQYTGRVDFIARVRSFSR